MHPFFNNLELHLYRVIFIYEFWKFSYINKLSTNKNKTEEGVLAVCVLLLYHILE